MVAWRGGESAFATMHVVLSATVSVLSTSFRRKRVSSLLYIFTLHSRVRTPFLARKAEAGGGGRETRDGLFCSGRANHARQAARKERAGWRRSKRACGAAAYAMCPKPILSCVCTLRRSEESVCVVRQGGGQNRSGSGGWSSPITYRKLKGGGTEKRAARTRARAKTATKGGGGGRKRTRARRRCCCCSHPLLATLASSSSSSASSSLSIIIIIILSQSSPKTMRGAMHIAMSSWMSSLAAYGRKTFFDFVLFCCYWSLIVWLMVMVMVDG